MKVKYIELILTLILVADLFTRAIMAQSSCTNVLISLSPCLDYVSNNSSTPSSACCTQLASVVGSQPQCLCEVIYNSSSLGININQTQALKLPDACTVKTPPISLCNASSPAGSPGTPGAGSKNGGDSSDGNSFEISFFFMIMALYASIALII